PVGSVPTGTSKTAWKVIEASGGTTLNAVDSAVCASVASLSAGNVPSALSSPTSPLPIWTPVAVGLSTSQVTMTYSPSGSSRERESPTARTPVSVLTSVMSTSPIPVLPAPSSSAAPAASEDQASPSAADEDASADHHGQQQRRSYGDPG